MIRVMYSINAFGDDTCEAEKLNRMLEELMKEFGLRGKTKGKNYDNQFANFSGNYSSREKCDDDNAWNKDSWKNNVLGTESWSKDKDKNKDRDDDKDNKK